MDFNFLVLARKVFSQNIRKFANTGGGESYPCLMRELASNNFSQTSMRRPLKKSSKRGLDYFFLRLLPKKPSFIILQTWILPDYTTQYTNTALKTSRKLCLLVVERAPSTFAQGDTAAQDSSISNFFGIDICHCKNRLIWSK